MEYLVYVELEYPVAGPIDDPEYEHDFVVRRFNSMAEVKEYTDYLDKQSEQDIEDRTTYTIYKKTEGTQ